jgi:aminopeptidase I
VNLRQDWTTKLSPGGKYCTTRNDTSLIAFHISPGYIPGNPLAIVASHVDSLALKLKPVSKSEKGGFERLGVAPYSGGGASQSWDGSYSTWWDRDLGLGGRVLVEGKDGKIESRLISLGRPGENYS